MKILHCHHSLTSGGIEAMIVSLANTMRESEDVEICLIYKPLSSDIFISKVSKDIPIHNLGKTKQGFSFIMPFKIASFLIRNKFDVVQLHGFFYYYIIAIFLLHKKIRFFYTVHNDAKLENNRWDRLILPLKRAFFRWGWIHPITISDSSQSSFEAFYPKCSNVKIYNGIVRPNYDNSGEHFISSYKFSNQTKVFINPARICEQKNQLNLVKAFTALIKESHDVVLLIAGQCQNNDILSQLQPYFSDRIIYLGEIDHIPNLLHACDAMCLTSSWEGLPVVLLESLAVGCPPICSPVGGIPDVIKPGYNGLLLEGSSQTNIYNGIISFLELSEKDKISLRENCKASFADYEIHNATKKYLEAYSKA